MLIGKLNKAFLTFIIWRFYLPLDSVYLPARLLRGFCYFSSTNDHSIWQAILQKGNFISYNLTIVCICFKNPHNNRSAQLSISNLPGDLVLAFAFFVTELLFMNFPQALSRLATNPLSLAKAVKTNALYFL